MFVDFLWLSYRIENPRKYRRFGRYRCPGHASNVNINMASGVHKVRISMALANNVVSKNRLF